MASDTATTATTGNTAPGAHPLAGPPTGDGYFGFATLTDDNTYGAVPNPAEAAFLARLLTIRDDINLPDQYKVIIDRDKTNPHGRFYYQIEATRPDTYTGKTGKGRGSKAYLSLHATDSELVQTVFGLYNAYLHHEARETFLWRGRRVFGPHIDIQAHWENAERYDARPAPTTTKDPS